MEERVPMGMADMEAKILLVRVEQRERLIWAQRVVAQKETWRALPVSPVVVMLRERLSLRDLTLLR